MAKTLLSVFEIGVSNVIGMKGRRWGLGGGHRVQLSPGSPLPPLEELVKALQDELESDAGERSEDRPAPVTV